MRENLFQRLVLGCKAGLLSGVAYGILLQFLVTPLILKAEVFETNTNVSSASVSSTASIETHSHSHKHENKHHHHSSPSENETSSAFKRYFWTWIGSLLLGLALGVFSSICLSILEYTNLLSSGFFESKWKPALSVSAIGFVIFYGIPSLGLPPQLPGVVGSEKDFELRQAWWLQSIFLSSAVLILWFYLRKRFFKRRISRVVALVVLLGILFCFLFWIPGVPSHSTETSVPNLLRIEFVFKSALSNLALWFLIGFFVSNSIFKNREVSFPAETQRV